MPDSTAVQGDVSDDVTADGGQELPATAGDPARPANLSDLVRRAAERTPARAALCFRDRTVTWAELDDRVDAVARGLRALTPTAGSRVAIALPNVPEFAFAYFGAMRAGWVAVPVNPGYTARELRHVLHDAGARVLVATPAVLTAVATTRDELPDLHHVYAVAAGTAARPAGQGQPFAALAVAGGPVERADSDAEDLAVLLYTSGSSGAPKGVMLSHRALLANHEQLAAVSPPIVGPDDVVLLALPLFHAYGLNPGLGAVAYYGCTGVLVERFDPGDTLAVIRDQQVTTVVGAPQMYVAWSLLPEVAEAFRSVRIAVSGSAPLDAEAYRRLLDATGSHIFEGYGLTEAAPVVASALASPAPKIGSIGRPIPGVDVKLVGADGEPIEPAEAEADEHASPGTDPGEVWIRGANLFSGYWPDGHDAPDADGWWATGDIAYADADGDLFLVDRVDELIIVSGFNVYPHEVEQVLTAHPAIAEAAVLGVPHPYTGQTIKACVLLAPDTELATEDLIAHCEQNLARFKCPTAVEYVDRLPHTATGKVRKGELRARTGD